MHLDLSTPEAAERMRRSLAMLAPRAWALRREEAIDVLEVLLVAMHELQRLDRGRP